MLLNVVWGKLEILLLEVLVADLVMLDKLKHCLVLEGATRNFPRLLRNALKCIMDCIGKHAALAGIYSEAS